MECETEADQLLAGLEFSALHNSVNSVITTVTFLSHAH